MDADVRRIHPRELACIGGSLTWLGGIKVAC